MRPRSCSETCMAGSSARSADCMLSRSRAGPPSAAGCQTDNRRYSTPSRAVCMEQTLFDAIPSELQDERIDELVASPGLRIERIVSTGHASPPGFWSDQPGSEWVVVLSGSAGVLIGGGAQPGERGGGDALLPPPHQRYRVEWTDAHVPTVWLVVHYGPNRW